MNINIIKHEIRSKLNRKVMVSVYGMRNRVSRLEGILYKTYPNWISEQNFIELGNKLMSFIKIFSLWFPVDCLSKNFVLKMLH